MRPEESWGDHSPRAARPSSPTGIPGSRVPWQHARTPRQTWAEAAHRYASHPHLGHQEVPPSIPPSQGLWSMTSGEPMCCKCTAQLQTPDCWCGARPRGKMGTHFPEEVENWVICATWSLSRVDMLYWKCGRDGVSQSCF